MKIFSLKSWLDATCKMLFVDLMIIINSRLTGLQALG